MLIAGVPNFRFGNESSRTSSRERGNDQFWTYGITAVLMGNTFNSTRRAVPSLPANQWYQTPR